MNKHTPGPWAIKFRGDHSAYISLGDPTTGGPHKQFDIAFDSRHPSDVADARLIAAAPDLLAALKALLAVAPPKAPGAGVIVGSEEKHKAAIAAARAAVAKAEGAQS
jgi:hypothetical protein